MGVVCLFCFFSFLLKQGKGRGGGEEGRRGGGERGRDDSDGYQGSQYN